MSTTTFAPAWRPDELAILHRHMKPSISDADYKLIVDELAALNESIPNSYTRTIKGVRVRMGLLRTEYGVKPDRPLPFSESERQFLQAYVHVSPIDWEALARQMPGRTVNSIRSYIRNLRDGKVKEAALKKPDTKAIRRQCLNCRVFFVSPDRRKIFLCPKCK